MTLLKTRTSLSLVLILTPLSLFGAGAGSRKPPPPATAYASLQKNGVKDEFFVPVADSISAGCEQVQYKEFALACHRITRGGQTVVGVREYADQGLDKEHFRKVTIVVDGGLQAGTVLDISKGQARAFYSTGASFMPGKSGCHGKGVSGTILVRTASTDVLELDINVVFDLKSPLGWPGHCGLRDYQATAVAKSLSFERLGPWEGVRSPGDSVIAEAVPAIIAGE